MGYTPPTLYLLKGTGKWSAYGLGATTDDLYIYPNLVDTTPYIVLAGTSAITLYGTVSHSNAAGTDFCNISYVSPDCIIANNIATKNIYLKPPADGYVKLGGLSGGYVAGAATDSTGYLPVLDSGGNVRKVMIQA